MKNGFKKLLRNVEMNAIVLNENGEWDFRSKGNNHKRWTKPRSGIFAGTQGTQWTPRKTYLTENDLRKIWNNQKEQCYWLKIPLDFGLLFPDHPDYFPKHPLAPSVDIKNDDGDYTIENVVICCRAMNFARNTFPFEEFHEVVKIIKGELKQPPKLNQFFSKKQLVDA